MVCAPHQLTRFPHQERTAANTLFSAAAARARGLATADGFVQIGCERRRTCLRRASPGSGTSLTAETLAATVPFAGQPITAHVGRDNGRACLTVVRTCGCCTSEHVTALRWSSLGMPLHVQQERRMLSVSRWRSRFGCGFSPAERNGSDMIGVHVDIARAAPLGSPRSRPPASAASPIH